MIDYQTQQFKLFPLIATAYALLKAGQYMMRMFIQCRAEISEGNLESLPEVSQLFVPRPPGLFRNKGNGAKIASKKRFAWLNLIHCRLSLTAPCNQRRVEGF